MLCLWFSKILLDRVLESTVIEVIKFEENKSCERHAEWGLLPKVITQIEQERRGKSEMHFNDIFTLRRLTPQF